MSKLTLNNIVLIFSLVCSIVYGQTNSDSTIDFGKKEMRFIGNGRIIEGKWQIVPALGEFVALTPVTLLPNEIIIRDLYIASTDLPASTGKLEFKQELSDTTHNTIIVCASDSTYPFEFGIMLGPVKDSNQYTTFVPFIWANGVVHKIVGKLYMAGYTFISDNNNPLVFQVEQSKGYKYISGRGVVIEPNGEKLEFNINTKQVVIGKGLMK